MKMTRTDDILRKALGKTRQQQNFWQSRPNTAYKPAQVKNNILPRQTTSARPASVRQQNMWSNMPMQQKIVNRVLLKDADRDGYPNKYDCQPNNQYRDESKPLLIKKKPYLYKKTPVLYAHYNDNTFKEADKNPGNWIIVDSYESEDDAADEQQNIDDESLTGDKKGGYIKLFESRVVKNPEVRGDYMLILRKLPKPHKLE